MKRLDNEGGMIPQAVRNRNLDFSWEVWMKSNNYSVNLGTECEADARPKDKIILQSFCICLLSVNSY